MKLAEIKKLIKKSDNVTITIGEYNGEHDININAFRKNDFETITYKIVTDSTEAEKIAQDITNKLKKHGFKVKYNGYED